MSEHCIDRRQIPTLIGLVFAVALAYLCPIWGALAESEGPSDCQLELTFWNDVKDSRDPQELQAYLDEYPNGAFAKLAQVRIGRFLSPAGTQSEPSPAKVPSTEPIGKAKPQEKPPPVQKERWISNRNGSVTDRETNLVWLARHPYKGPFLFTIPQQVKVKDWHYGLRRCQGLRLGEYKGWRYPTLDELKQVAGDTDPKDLTCVWSNERTEGNGVWAYDFRLRQAKTIPMRGYVPCWYTCVFDVEKAH